MEDTKITNRTYLKTDIALNREQIKNIIETDAIRKIDSIKDDLKNFIIEIKPILDKRFIVIENKDVWFDRNVAALYPRTDRFRQLTYANLDIDALKYLEKVSISGLSFVIPNIREADMTFHSNNDRPYYRGNCQLYKGYLFDICYDWHACRYIVYNNDDGRYYVRSFNNANGNYSFPYVAWQIITYIHHLVEVDAEPMTFAESILSFWENDLLPKDLNKQQAKKFAEYVELYKLIGKYFKAKDTTVEFKADEFKNDVLSGKFTKTVNDYNFNLRQILADVLDGKMQYKASLEEVKEDLLKCDYKRANFAVYDESRIIDNNRGHWELAEEVEEGMAAVTLPDGESWVARPPQLDIVQSGTCAIDFGTKSTVVVCRRKKARLLRVGKGDYTTAPTMDDYENPTAIEFFDLKAFNEAYAKRIGRPFTQWNQVAVSHKASDDLRESKDSSIYYTIFSELKQWANDKKRRLMLNDQQGNAFELKPYLELTDGEFDPIELYAYYLGMYINNMYNGIYLDYILSFPVNYAKDVRDKLLQSFERGLRKSLPPALLKDETKMRNFRVYAGASEPAAYAISALKEFDLEPKEINKKVAYSVFDFGGGTTDFDFGYEEVPENKRNKFVIHQFGKGGDVYLGGENILELLAYEVFKDNIKIMRESKITFVLPPVCQTFAGSETLVFQRQDAPQQAYMNTRRIAEKLRPIWERHDEYKKIYSEGQTPMQLFASDKSENNMVTVKVDIDVDKLEKCIEKRIEDGVKNFFTAMNEAFADKKIEAPIHIFLAGNSCKSPIVVKLFNKYIAEKENDLAEKILCDTGIEKVTKGTFKLHLPLGMKIETEEITEEDISIYNIDKVLDNSEVTEEEGLHLYEARGRLETESIAEFTDELKKSVVDIFKKYNIVRENIVNDNQNIDVSMLDCVRTGKTGVAFGLLRSRKGGKDVKIDNKNIDKQGEMIFPYLLGELDEDACFNALIGFKVGYGQWQRFCFADEEDFELYYTTDAKALDEKIDESQVQMVRCSIDSDDVCDDDDVGIYIRKVTPDKIEYAVGKQSDFEDGELKMKVYSQMLS